MNSIDTRIENHNDDYIIGLLLQLPLKMSVGVNMVVVVSVISYKCKFFLTPSMMALLKNLAHVCNVCVSVCSVYYKI